MVKKKYFIFLVFLLSSIIAFSGKSYAQAEFVKDDGNLFSSSDIAQFESSLKTIKSKYNMDFILVTTLDAKGQSAMDYADNYYRDIYGKNHDGGILSIDMDNREVRISVSGIAIDYFTDYRQGKILDAAVPYLKDNNFSAAGKTLISETEHYLASGIPSNQYREEKDNRLSIVEGLLGLGSGAAIGGAFFGINKRRYSGRPRANRFSYENNSLLNLANSKDVYLTTNTTTRIISRDDDNDNDSGRSTTYTSGGDTRSSSGRGF